MFSIDKLTTLSGDLKLKPDSLSYRELCGLQPVVKENSCRESNAAGIALGWPSKVINKIGPPSLSIIRTAMGAFIYGDIYRPDPTIMQSCRTFTNNPHSLNTA